MIRYKINLTAMQWGLIAVDLGRLPESCESSQALKSLIMLALDHQEHPDFVELPYNIEIDDDQG